MPGTTQADLICQHFIPAVIANLEHRHSYVRKNAVLALAAIYKLPKGELLVPDAPEVVEKLLQVVIAIMSQQQEGVLVMGVLVMQ